MNVESNCLGCVERKGSIQIECLAVRKHQCMPRHQWQAKFFKHDVKVQSAIEREIISGTYLNEE
jgi:hypothetical protein